MAFNWKTFQIRTLTAIVFAAVMLTGLLWNYWSFLILFSIIQFGCWWEYLKLSEKIYKTLIDTTIKYFFCICGFLVFLAVGYSHYSYDFWWAPFGYKLSLKWGLILLIFICLFAFLFQNKQLPDKLKWFVAVGLVYISLSLGLMINLSFWNKESFYVSEVLVQIKTTGIYSAFIPCSIVFSIWINDTMAYIVGSLIGKTSLSKISPKKTWEGTIGGIILAVLVAGIIAWQLGFDIKMMIIISAIASISGTFGDLLESKLKRMAGVKDSGSLMPGHGGFLDRFDSLLLAIPAVWLYIFLFIK